MNKNFNIQDVYKRQVIHTVQPGQLPQLAARLAGAQRREIPGRKIHARAVLCFRAGIGLVQPAEYPHKTAAVLQLSLIHI